MVATLVSYFSPYLLRGEDSFVLVHDYLDNVNRYGAMVRGRPEAPGWRPDRWWVYALGLFWGGVANAVVIRVVAALGMLALLSRLPGAGALPLAIRTLAALTFATLPFYPVGNLAVAGVPALAALLFGLDDRRSRPWIVAALLALGVYSRPTLTGPWLLVALLAWVLWRWRAGKRVLPFVLGAAAFLAGMFVPMMEIQGSLADVVAGQSNRAEIVYARDGDLRAATWRAFQMLTSGQYHAHSLHRPIILPSIALICVALAAMHFRGCRMERAERRLALGLMLFLGLSAALYGVFYYEPIMSVYQGLGIGFNFSRLHYLAPAAWYLLWALLLFTFYRLVGHRRVLALAVSALLLAQIAVNFEHFTVSAFEKRPTFRQYFAQELFDKIDQVLDLGAGDKVGCIGFYPAVANYHGLSTLGFYTNIYPLERKRRMQRVIQAELDANEEIRRYFMDWGSRAYLFNAEIGRGVGDQAHMRALSGVRSRLNPRELLAAKVKYLLSTVPITNAKLQGYQQVFRGASKDGYYRMFVYRITSAAGVGQR